MRSLSTSDQGRPFQYWSDAPMKYYFPKEPDKHDFSGYPAFLSKILRILLSEGLGSLQQFLGNKLLLYVCVSASVRRHLILEQILTVYCCLTLQCLSLSLSLSKQGFRRLVGVVTREFSSCVILLQVLCITRVIFLPTCQSTSTSACAVHCMWASVAHVCFHWLHYIRCNAHIPLRPA